METLEGAYQNIDPNNLNCNKKFVIESKPVTCATWSENQSFYIFDPKPRNGEGQNYRQCEWDENPILKALDGVKEEEINLNESEANEDVEKEEQSEVNTEIGGGDATGNMEYI